MARDVHRHAIDHDEIVKKHFARLNRLLQDEEREDRHRFKSDYLDKKPEDREKGGKALLRLVLVASHFNPSGQRLLSFSFANDRNLPRYSLDVGDVVKLSGFQIPEAECPVGTVYEKEKKKITVAFGPKLPGWVGQESLYHLSVSENLTTYDRMYSAIREVGGASHNRMARLRDISLELKKAEFKDPISPDQIEWVNKHLNETQKKAVCMALEAEDVAIIHGPPGTGKTRVLVEIISQARKKGESILVSAPSNAACDYLVECLIEAKVPVTRLGHPARMTERIREHTLAYKVARHPYAKMIDKNESRLDQLNRQKERRQDRRVMSWEKKNEMYDEIRALRQDIRNLKAEIFNQVWNASDVVVATHTVAGDPILKSRVFDWVVIDEATQGIEPSTWIPIARANKVVMAGDHCQLPPTIFSNDKRPDSLRFTLFERFHKILDDRSKIRLEVQYRMNEKIMDFSSQEFYDKALIADPGVRHHVLADLHHVKKEEPTESPIIFLDTAGLGFEEAMDASSSSFYNEDEAKLLIQQYRHLIDAGVNPHLIGIVSPYSAQVKLLNNLLLQDQADDPVAWKKGPEIDSVDSFQGREKEAILVSLVRSNLEGKLGFLADTRRMNVAMTRARRKLVVIGDSATLSNIPFYEDFMRYVEKIGAYRSAWEYQ